MPTIILDCYTDEPSGLGVPPYLGTYPRYIYGYLKASGEKEIKYLTIDDLRLLKKHNLQKKQPKASEKTNISTYNLTKNINNIKSILTNASKIIIICGVHTPGKYLSATPGTLSEISKLVKDLNCEITLTGPAIFGTRLHGGGFQEKLDTNIFQKTQSFDFSYNEIKFYAIKGAEIVKQIPDIRIAEIETSHGCSRKPGCSFCTEPLKHNLEFREKEDILEEITELNKQGIKHFRLGKQSCFYSLPYASELIKEIRKQCKIEMLHIDNVNPVNVLSNKGQQLTKDIVKYCTSGNVAAFGVESFDKDVIKANNLNTTPENTYEAIKILNKHGKIRGENGMPKFLPGINILFGLESETKQTNEQNMLWLKKILKNNLLLRRINIRLVNIYEGTPLHNKTGNKFLKKNRKYYWKWRNEIRQNIDIPMLKNLTPIETVLKDIRAEIYDGKTTFARQLGTYPLIVGIKQRLELNKFYNVKITDHMLRSVTGEII